MCLGGVLALRVRMVYLFRNPFFQLASGVVLVIASALLFANATGWHTGVSSASSYSRNPEKGKLGRHIFKKNCLICHQASGLGTPFLYPPLAKSEWVLAQDSHSKEDLILILLHGLQGPIKVRGTIYNGYMSGWSHLSDSEIAAVLSYIRTEWGNLAVPITSQKVAIIRKSVLRTQPWTWNELYRVSRFHQEGERRNANNEKKGTWERRD